MSDDVRDVITVYRAGNSVEANFVKNLLVDAGIQAEVAEENEPLAGLPITPPDVLVQRGDLAAAEAIVAVFEQQKQTVSSSPNWTCPKCGESVPASFDECYNCGADAPQSA